MPAPVVLWNPPADGRSTTAIGRFATFAELRTGRTFAGYDALWRWSVDDLEGLWAAVWDFFAIPAERRFDHVLSGRAMPGARWFEGARLNYATRALDATRPGAAVVAVSQTRGRRELSWPELVDAVGRARAGLARAGVQPGDRVAAYLPNIPECVIAFLAAASLGATFTTCAPEFGVPAVLDRFGQVAPKVLLAIDGYRYGERAVDRRDEVAAIRAGLPSVETVVHVAYLDDDAPPPTGAIAWDALLARDDDDPGIAAVAPDHPLYVLYSSGTTGLPKPIVHGHGGILAEHLKVLGLHADLGPGDRFAWFTTTGWMMWNFLVSGLLVGATVVLYDGDPTHPGPDALWRFAAGERLTWFGASAPFIVASRRAGLTPGRDLDLTALRTVGSTGAPLPADGFEWVYDAVAAPEQSLVLSSISGGTDVCSAFVGGCPIVPVWAGEISCRYLGAAVAAYDEAGRSVVGAQGELVIEAPMPSMPVAFWGDTDGARRRAAYFERFPGVWCHGDWVTITERGSCIITGRSDATLNRGGVRIGTAEIYRVVESVAGVLDSLVVHVDDADGGGGGGAGKLVLLVVADGELTGELALAIRRALRTELSPRHVPDEIHGVRAIPTTLSGKKLEVPVKRILGGADADRVASRGALRDPSALDDIVALAHERTTVADR